MDAHNGAVTMPVEFDAVKTDYYRGVGATLLEHLRGREVLGFGALQRVGTSAPDQERLVSLHVNDLDDLEEAVRSGILGFSLPALTRPGIAGFRISAGTGTGIDTVATVTLALAQSLLRDGLTAIALTDGYGDINLFGFELFGLELAPRRSTASGPNASGYAAALAAAAPEIATTDNTDVDGRALLEALPTGSPVPAPYSLVRATDPTGVAVPLTLDEVAAASAGMPLAIGFGQAAGRIAEYGDLAAALSRATARSA